VERTIFNSDGYPISEVEAVGTTIERTTTTTRQAGSNFVTSVVDGLNRQTAYTYDTAGRMLTLTRLAGTLDAVTTALTYEPTFGQLATVTDPLNHTWTVGYSSGRPVSVTDPMSHRRP
jgi:YD repeat-containing protein